MLVICDNCYITQDTRPGAYCPGCLGTGHLFPLRDEADLRRGIRIYAESTIPRAMAENAIARKAEAIRLLSEAIAGGAP